MKVMTIVGTRPEIIRMSLIARVLDQHTEHLLVHTGEQSDESLSSLFITDLDMRQPDVDLRPEQRAKTPEELALRLDQYIQEFSPERLLFVDGSMSADAAAIAGSQISSFVLGPNATTVEKYPDRTLPMKFCSLSSRAGRQIVTGCPIREVLDTFDEQIEASGVLAAVGVKPFDYFLATLHAEENLRSDELQQAMDTLSSLAETFGRPVLLAAHPELAKRLSLRHITPSSEKLRILRALNYFDFIKLQKNALCILTDSVGVQEEAMVLRVPTVTLSRSTSRTETIACGANMLAGIRMEDVVRAVEISIAQPAAWEPPAGYLRNNVSQIVSKLVTSVG